MTPYVLIFDCGATNVRVLAMAPDGSIKASKAFANRTVEDPYCPGGRIWSLQEIWDKLCQASLYVVAQLGKHPIVGVSVTTFGVDGTFVRKDGSLAYPVISWQCGRTAPILERIADYVPVKELYEKSGVYPYNFNTICKLIWFKENRPAVFKDTQFLFMPSLLIKKLSGVQINDQTMLGTSMLADATTQELAPEILNRIGIGADAFLPCGTSGAIVGQITAATARATGIPEKVPVCLSGHDTQFAIFGSGANFGEPVLSSGTWEILMCRSKKFSASTNQLDLGITTEFDSEQGNYNIGVNYLASGLLEWIGDSFYRDLPKPGRYTTMIQEAAAVAPGANGIVVTPDFYNLSNKKSDGQISGLRLGAKRGEIYRAALEALSLRLKKSLVALETAGGFKANKIICVGGGTKNSLWNQIKADMCNLPIQLIAQKETTALGSALHTFTGVGHFKDLQEARAQVKYDPQLIHPSENSAYYQNID